MREMTSASNMDDARSRASRVLEVLEKSICARANAEAANNFHQVLELLQFLLFVYAPMICHYNVWGIFHDF